MQSISIYDDSMHASTIKLDTTDHVPQVIHNMKAFKSTIKAQAQSPKSNSYQLQETSSTDNDENNTSNEDPFDIDIDEFNHLDITQRKNKNLINLKHSKSRDIIIDDEKLKKANKCKQCHDKCCYSLPILHPHGNLRVSWDCVIMIILIYTCVEIPYSLAFGIDLTLHDTFGVIALCIDCLLLFDVILNFRTAFFDAFDHQMLIYDPPRIAWKYLTTWFILDFLTSIPFEFIIPQNSAGNFPSLIKILRIFRMIRLLKLLRFFRMLKTFNSIIASFMTRSIIILAKLLKLLSLMTLSAHFAACIWYYVGKRSFINEGPGQSWLYPDGTDPDSSILDSSNGEKYLTSFYFAVVTLYTTGYGDITPKSLNEKLTCSACILVGTCFFAYFIGAVGSLVAEGDRVKCAQIQKVEEAQAFCAAKKLPAPVAHALMSHAKYHWQRNFVFDDMDVMNSLPGYLRRDVGNCLSDKYFNHLSIFHDLSPYIRGLIALRLRCVSCNSDYELFHAQQYGKEMFIQRTGISYLLDADKKLHKITRGGVVGYYALLNPVRQTTLKCSSWCEFYALDRDDIQDILRTNFPRAWRPLWLKIKARIKELYERKEATVNISIKRDKDIKFLDDENLNKDENSNNKMFVSTFDEKGGEIELNCLPKTVPTLLPSESTIYNTTSSTYTTSFQSMDSEQRRKKFSKLRTFSMKRFSSDNIMVGKTVNAAKNAKNTTQRKLKLLLQVSDSEMRNDKVLSKPRMTKHAKNKRYRIKYEKRLKWKMMRERHKREMKGIDEIIPTFNNNKPIKNYFENIINEETETKLNSDGSDLFAGNNSSEEHDEHYPDSEEWAQDDDDSDYGNTAGGNYGSKKRGVSGVGGKKVGGFKGMKKVKMNKVSKGIKSVRPKIKKKKKRRIQQKERAQSATPRAYNSNIDTIQKSESPPRPQTNVIIKLDSFSKSIIDDLSLLEIKKNKKKKSEEIVISVSETEGLLNNDIESNNNIVHNEDNKLKGIDEYSPI